MVDGSSLLAAPSDFGHPRKCRSQAAPSVHPVESDWRDASRFELMGRSNPLAERLWFLHYSSSVAPNCCAFAISLVLEAGFLSWRFILHKACTGVRTQRCMAELAFVTCDYHRLP